MWDHGRCPWHEFSLLCRELPGLQALDQLTLTGAVDLALSGLSSDGDMYRAAQMKELQMAAYDYWTPEHARRQMLNRLRRSKK